MGRGLGVMRCYRVVSDFLRVREQRELIGDG
jgi:hypothetical protein